MGLMDGFDDTAYKTMILAGLAMNVRAESDVLRGIFFVS